MQTQFNFRHMESSDAVRAYAEERLEKLTRYFADAIKVSGTFSVEKIHHIARFEATLGSGLQLQAAERTENMYSSIDLALAKMERQVRRYKDRIRDHRGNDGRGAKVRMRILAEEATDAAVPDAPVASKPHIVRESEFDAKRMSVESAIMQMNLLHREFLVFANDETGEMNVVYRRDDGAYGLIEGAGGH